MNFWIIFVENICKPLIVFKRLRGANSRVCCKEQIPEEHAYIEKGTKYAMHYTCDALNNINDK